MLIAIGVATYALRMSFVFLFEWLDTVPTQIEKSLRFVPPAVLAALAVPALVTLSTDPVAGFVFDSDRVVAATVAAIVAWQTERVFLTIVVGMVALWGLQVV